MGLNTGPGQLYQDDISDMENMAIRKRDFNREVGRIMDLSLRLGIN